MTRQDKLRKQELECLRIAAECLQLACDVPDPALRSHFVRMAKLWPILAERGLNADIRMENELPVRPACTRMTQH